MPVPFQNNCSNSTAQYTLNTDNTITVLNRCEANGQIIEANGIAYPNYPEISNGIYPGSLTVYFDNNNSGGQYNIIDLDPNYQYAMVAGSGYDNLWILSRTQSLNQNTYNYLVQKARSLGFNVNNLIVN